MDNNLPMDEMARYRSFMAKTQLLQTQTDEPNKKGSSPWLRKRKLKKMSKPNSPVTVRKHTEEPRLAQTIHPNMLSQTKRPAVSKPQTSLNILPIRLCDELDTLPDRKTILHEPVLPIRQKIRLYQKDSIQQFPFLTSLRRTIIHESRDVLKSMRSRSKKKKQSMKLKTSESITLAPLLKYQNNQQNGSISQLNRLVTREVFYKLSKTRNQTEV